MVFLNVSKQNRTMYCGSCAELLQQQSILLEVGQTINELLKSIIEMLQKDRSHNIKDTMTDFNSQFSLIANKQEQFSRLSSQPCFYSSNNSTLSTYAEQFGFSMRDLNSVSSLLDRISSENSKLTKDFIADDQNFSVGENVHAELNNSRWVKGLVVDKVSEEYSLVLVKNQSSHIHLNKSGGFSNDSVRNSTLPSSNMIIEHFEGEKQICPKMKKNVEQMSNLEEPMDIE